MASTTPNRAVGIIRVSQPKDRSGDSFSSPQDQRDSIEKFCADHGWKLIDVFEEMHVSGDALLADRPGLSQAVVAVQTGTADIILGPYSSRLWWNHETRAQVLRLVREAGGQVWTVDGRVDHDDDPTADFVDEMMTSSDRKSRRENAKNAKKGLARAIARGVPPWPNVTPGFLLNDDGTYRKDLKLAPVVLEAFEMRAKRKTVKEIRDYMRENGFPGMEHRTVERLLADRSGAVRGHIYFGSLPPNERAHDEIVSEELWKAVQNTKVPRGRLAKSERLLARTQVLRCGTCDRSMVIGRSNRKYFAYRCTWMDCPRRCTIAAPMIEEVAALAAVARAMHTTGHASTEQDVRMAEIEVEATWEALKRRIATLDGYMDVPGAREQLAALRQANTDAQEQLAALRGTETTVHIDIASDWDRLALADQRELVKSTIRRIVIASGGKGLERVTVEGHHDEQFVITDDPDGLTVSVLAPAPADVEAAAQRVADRAARRQLP